MRAGCFRDSVLIQDKGDPATTFVEQREQYPKRDGILQHLQPYLFISVFGEGPFQSSTRILDISTVDLTPIVRRLPFPVSDGLLTDSLKIGGVTSGRQVCFATISKLLQRIEANCFEKAIARRRGGYIQMKKRFANKISQQVNDSPLILDVRAADTMGRLHCKSGRKNRQPAEECTLSLIQKAVTPIHSRS